jgi:hypothetical protein
VTCGTDLNAPRCWLHLPLVFAGRPDARLRRQHGERVLGCFDFVETEVFVVNPYLRSSCGTSDTGCPSPVRSQGSRYIDETEAYTSRCTALGLKLQRLRSRVMGTLGYGRIWKLITEDSPPSAEETDHSTYSSRSSTPTSVTSERSFSDGERKRKGKIAKQVLSTMVSNNG